MAAAHACIVIWEGQQCCSQSYQHHLQHRVVAQTCVLPPSAPGHVGTDEKRPPQAAKNPKQNKRDELHQVPRCVELHVEEDKAAVAKGIDGAQGEGGHQGSEKRTPQCL